MKAKFLGSKGVDFINNAGQAIKGTTMYYAFKDESVSGLCADKAFLKPSIGLPEGIKSGDEIEVTFDNRGKILTVGK